ncbi:hypothetical protein MNBD_ALPHA06-949 [hydrothermal vent metagenome]|uniref:Uncharacterized protein n=1 Tax=hydrothermal vent metagenome TaxID=652676 RepID=A0A3B0RUK6_9ZZZZ
MKISSQNMSVATLKISAHKESNPSGKFLLASLLTFFGTIGAAIWLVAKLQTATPLIGLLLPMVLLIGLGLCTYVFSRAWWVLSQE